MALFLVPTGRDFHGEFYPLISSNVPVSTNVLLEHTKNQVGKLARFMAPWVKGGHIYTAPDPASIQTTRILLNGSANKAQIVSIMGHSAKNSVVRIADSDMKFFSNIQNSFWLPFTPCNAKRCLDVIRQISLDPSVDNVVMVAGTEFVRKFVECFSDGNLVKPIVNFTCSIIHYCPETKKIIPLLSVDPCN